MRKKEILSLVATWIESITLSQINQTEKDKQHMISSRKCGI